MNITTALPPKQILRKAHIKTRVDRIYEESLGKIEFYVGIKNETSLVSESWDTISQRYNES